MFRLIVGVALVVSLAGCGQQDSVQAAQRTTADLKAEIDRIEAQRAATQEREAESQARAAAIMKHHQQTVLDNELDKWRMVRNSSSASTAQVCVQAQMVAAAYLQIGDQKGFDEFSKKANTWCS